MAISATFNIGYLSPYAEDTIDLRLNPPKVGEVNVGGCLPRDLEGNKSKED